MPAGPPSRSQLYVAVAVLGVQEALGVSTPPTPVPPLSDSEPRIVPGVTATLVVTGVVV